MEFCNLCCLPKKSLVSLEEDVITSSDEEEEEFAETSDKDVTDEEQLTREKLPNAPQIQILPNSPSAQKAKTFSCSKCNKKFFAYKIHPSHPQQSLQTFCSLCRAGSNSPDTQLGRMIVKFQQKFIFVSVDHQYKNYLGQVNSIFNSNRDKLNRKRKRFFTKDEFTRMMNSLTTKGEDLVIRAQNLLFQCHLCPSSANVKKLDSSNSCFSCFSCHFSCCDKHYDQSTNVCHFCQFDTSDINRNLSLIVADKLKQHDLLLKEFEKLFHSF
jgi:hypothetical protein